MLVIVILIIVYLLFFKDWVPTSHSTYHEIQQPESRDNKSPKQDFVEFRLSQSSVKAEPYPPPAPSVTNNSGGSLGRMGQWSYVEKVVGVTYEGRQQVIAHLKLGETIVLKREPNNPYDSNAIRVERLSDGKQIGYLKREKAALLAPMFDRAGGSIVGKVYELIGGTDRFPTRGVKVSFSLASENLPDTVREEAKPSKVTRLVSDITFEEEVVGLRSKPKQAMLAELREGDRIILRRENNKDGKRIRVITEDSRTVGYLSREREAILAPLFDEAGVYRSEGVISRIIRGTPEDPYSRLIVRFSIVQSDPVYGKASYRYTHSAYDSGMDYVNDVDLDYYGQSKEEYWRDEQEELGSELEDSIDWSSVDYE